LAKIILGKKTKKKREKNKKWKKNKVKKKQQSEKKWKKGKKIKKYKKRRRKALWITVVIHNDFGVREQWSPTPFRVLLILFFPIKKDYIHGIFWHVSVIKNVLKWIWKNLCN
jgi:hypothetical protein